MKNLCNISKVPARKGKVVAKSNFCGYDFCLNTYVGCQFGCSFCYVRWFVKDKEKPWGEFVRRREHVVKQLPKELNTIAGKRLVMGTMCDVYQPEERTHRLTRSVLNAILAASNPPTKVGIFTRSPIVLDDVKLIVQLPKARVHFTVTPVDREVSLLIEAIAVQPNKKWDVVRKLKQAGIRTHVNVAPAIPIISNRLTEEFCRKLHELEVDEFFVDPMQAYSNSFTAFVETMKNHKDWPAIYKIMSDKTKYAEWKKEFKQEWDTAWKQLGNEKALPIWCDHENRNWVDMRTGIQMDLKVYGDDVI